MTTENLSSALLVSNSIIVSITLIFDDFKTKVVSRLYNHGLQEILLSQFESKYKENVSFQTKTTQYSKFNKENSS